MHNILKKRWLNERNVKETLFRNSRGVEERSNEKPSIFSKTTHILDSGLELTWNGGSYVWLAKWCKIHKVYIHSHSMLLLIFTNIFIHIQQPNLHSRNIFIHIYLCISYSRLYLLTFTRCLHSHSTSYIHSHSRSKYSFNIFCASPLRISIKYRPRTTDYGLRTTDWV